MQEFRVIDTFIFGGEIEMLKMRLDYLYDSVDYFVFSESTVTHTGQKKELCFPKNLQMFEKYMDKIEYIVYEPVITDLKLVANPENIFDSDLWKLERNQRSEVHEKVKELSDESTLILHSDCDEFPDKLRFDELREMTKNLVMEVVSLEQPTYYYSPLNLLEMKWYGTVAFNYQTLMNISDYFSVRENRFHSMHLEKAGWHFLFFASPEKISYKIQTYAHQEYNIPEITSIDVIKNKIYNGLDVLNRPDVKITKLDLISDEFPMEFYRHEIFFKNTFDRNYLKLQQVFRRNRSMQIPLEIENLQLTIANRNPKVIVEIGTANGGTLARWLELPSVETIISIDYPIGIHGGQGFEERTYVISDALEQANLCGKQFYAVNGDSKDPYLINRVSELLDDRKIDFLFIDGDHTYEGVKGDFNLYERFLSDTAVVGFHDIIDSKFHNDAGCHVFKFWEELKNKFEWTEFVYTQHLDSKISPFFGETKKYGGFGGIGIVDYSKKKSVDFHLDDAISLVVPVYKNIDDTIKNIDITLDSSTLIKEVIIYSNGSSDEENNKLFNKYSSSQLVKVVTAEKPIGFIKAVNELFKLAKYETILCMNSDAHLGLGWEERLLPYINNLENGIVGPVKVRDFILGCCFIVKKRILNKLGMLNEGFGLGYVDDVEFSNRVERNGLALGYFSYKNDFGWNTHIDFPIYHRQGASFELLDNEFRNELDRINTEKYRKFKNSKSVIVLKNLTHKEIKKTIDTENIYIAFNFSGEEFEKIRYDNDIIKLIHLFEITPEMNIDTVINSVTIGKKIEILTSGKDLNLTWLAKFDDYSSMGILSQRIIENLDDINISCKEIIGETETNNDYILNIINKQINPEIGIMFAYPDMVHELESFKNKVIYTGADSTGGISNFAQNCNRADFLLTPSNSSKNKMKNIGVNKPIFVFPHGIDPEKFRFKERKKGKKFKFLYVGECSDRKGIFHLLQAFEDLFKDDLSVELYLKSNTAMLFYGGDEVRKRVDSLANVFWDTSDEGHEKTLSLYDECHAYVYPSRADTFGMTLIEAAACGLPIISTNDPGATELLTNRYYSVESSEIQISGHPWMLGKWGEPNLSSLKKQMKFVYDNYDKIIKSGDLKTTSEWIVNNYSWQKVTDLFKKEILPKFNRKYRILTLLTSFNRKHHIKNVIASLQNIEETGVINHTYIVDNSNGEDKDEIVKTIRETIDSNFTLHVAEFNYGQRGALLQMLEDVNLDEYDFIQFTDQDNIFNERLSVYCDILKENKDITFVTGYMSKEHAEMGYRETRFGRLYEKRSLRAGHMFMKVEYLKSLFPIHLDGEYGQPHNSSWNAGLDWELSYWNKKSIGPNSRHPFVLCVPNGVVHKGIDSTFYEWNVEENEYSTGELISLR